MKKTITVEKATWKKLTNIKFRNDLQTIDETINHLIDNQEVGDVEHLDEIDLGDDV